MNKEQKIEEMLKIMCEEYGKQCNECIVETCSNAVIADRLFENGYRKILEDNIRETVEKPIDTQKREYENIDDIVRGFVVKDGKLIYVTNILDGCRHEFKDIYEICDELNNNMKEIDRLMELNNHLRFQLKECKKLTVKEFAEKFKEKSHKGAFNDPVTYKFIERDYTITESELKELLEEYENGKSL